MYIADIQLDSAAQGLYIDDIQLDSVAQLIYSIYAVHAVSRWAGWEGPGTPGILIIRPVGGKKTSSRGTLHYSQSSLAVYRILDRGY